jgi:uncharacterized protein YndB with AHSA1/START domain
MPDLQRLQFSVRIHAPVARVWQLMFDPESYRDWTSAFMEGSYFEGSWEQGQRLRFLAPNGEGMLAEVAENRRHAFLSLRHIGFIADGQEDTDSEQVRALLPAHENYTFRAVPDGTELLIDQDVGKDHAAMMSEMWPKALARLKALSET